MFLNYNCWLFCPFWNYCYYYYSLSAIRVADPSTNNLPNEISQELQPDLFDIIPETIFEELNHEGIHQNLTPIS